MSRVFVSQERDGRNLQSKMVTLAGLYSREQWPWERPDGIRDQNEHHTIVESIIARNEYSRDLQTRLATFRQKANQ